ncbi:hypothetical protein SCE1572_28125 [Sorangium cellulosum So0157-2]|uniref:Uncharacterized protein n=1 Tax=Sorangium cellulosum So0157-2 TaxID=1254432 RepID=S4XZW0_SORCE|nr:hypothetical protein SCE1572_28125 [Sorangium cellulosum So0157-2]
MQLAAAGRPGARVGRARLERAARAAPALPGPAAAEAGPAAAEAGMAAAEAGMAAA